MPDVIRPRWRRDMFSSKVANSRYYYSRISSPPFGRFGITAFSTGISAEKGKERVSEKASDLLFATGRLSPFSRARFFSFSSLTSERHFAAKALSRRFGQLVRVEEHFAMWNFNFLVADAPPEVHFTRADTLRHAPPGIGFVVTFSSNDTR